jgi:hypothetical protein
MEHKTEIPGLYKVKEGILINKDNDALRAYRNKRDREKSIDKIREDVDQLKNDIAEIKYLIKGLSK